MEDIRIDIATAAERTGLKPATLRTLARRRLVDAVQILGRWMFDEEDVLSVARTGTADRVAREKATEAKAQKDFRNEAESARGGRKPRRKAAAVSL